MCFVGEPFGHDIFVSYSHGDPDGRGTSPLKEWSRALIRHLEQEIRSPYPDFDPLQIFIDEQLDPTLALTAELREHAQAAGLLMVIMTERWLKSAWCEDEIGWFQEQVASRGGPDGAVIVVRAFPTNTSLWPDCLKDERGNVLTGIHFHPLPGGPGIPPYGWREDKPSDPEYWKAVAKLATTVMRRLQELKDREELRKAQVPAGRSINGTPRLYLLGRAGQEVAWAASRERLVEAGFEVKPIRLQPVGSSLLEIRRAQRDRLDELGRCDGFLILRTDSAEDITPILETCEANRACIEATGKYLPCGVLDLGSADVPCASDLGIEVLPGRGPGWLQAVRAWLDRAHASPPKTPVEVAA
jgi:hypothetical protein